MNINNSCHFNWAQMAIAKIRSCFRLNLLGNYAVGPVFQAVLTRLSTDVNNMKGQSFLVSWNHKVIIGRG